VDLTVKHPNTESTAMYYFIINKPPSNGGCQVTPIQGVELKTVFNFNCHNWTDDHQPITYVFSYMTAEKTTIILYSGFKSGFSETLSHGNKNITIYIMDRYLARTTTYVLLEVCYSAHQVRLA